jgi:hypothetical protein
MVQCPLCGDSNVHKKPSAPHLNLMTSRQDHRSEPAPIAAQDGAAGGASQGAPSADAGVAAAWLDLSRRILASTQDVGTQFAEEARKMHYGESEERAIRGQTTVDEARALVEEGIDVLPMLLPQSLKKTLQ